MDSRATLPEIEQFAPYALRDDRFDQLNVEHHDFLFALDDVAGECGLTVEQLNDLVADGKLEWVGMQGAYKVVTGDSLKDLWLHPHFQGARRQTLPA